MKTIIYLIILFFGTVAALDKATYDLPGTIAATEAERNSLNKSVFKDSRTITTNSLEVTMLPGGYFTIGTSNGYSGTSVDDHCGITHGHPYALTSYPVISIDGEWFKLADKSNNLSSLIPEVHNDSLMIRAEIDDIMELRFTIRVSNEHQVDFLFDIINLDSVDHDFGMALFLDPALGRNGDGAVFLNNQYQKTDTLIVPELSSRIEIFEKPSISRGMGFSMQFGENLPDGLILGNWHDLEKRTEPEFQNSVLRKLYDLDLHIFWDAITYGPGFKATAGIKLECLQPELDGPAFLRWDGPNFLSTETNLLFPREIATLLEIWNNQGSTLDGVSLEVECGKFLDASENQLDFQLGTNNPSYRNIDLDAKLTYEDLIVPVTIRLRQQDEIIEKLVRQVFIPATPVSDSGIVIVDDSLSVSDFPEINLVFAAEIAENGRRILQLQNENIWIYQNGSRIDDFSMEKYSDGGADLADIVFVLDCSGSMGDEIDDVRNNLGEFADSLEINGYDYRIGVVTFSTDIDNVWDFTDDIEQVKANLASVGLWGGVEDSPLALHTASELSFREGSKRTIIWVTDEEYPEHSYTKTEIVNRMLEMGITVHGVGPVSLQTEWFNPIVNPTGGNFYNILGNFRDIMLDVTRQRAFDKYIIEFESKYAVEGMNEIELEIRYAGLGGKKSLFFQHPGNTPPKTALVCFPNPFNPEIQFRVQSEETIKDAELRIFNTLGQCVRKYNLGQNPGSMVTWNAKNQSGIQVSSGFYIVHLKMTDIRGKSIQKQQKILYLK